MFSDKKVLIAPRLADEIIAAGIQPGSNIIMHSSLKSLGQVHDGPATVLEALDAVLGENGNLLVPTFTYSLPGWKTDPFDFNTSPARTGSIPEYIRNQPTVRRSFHPTHSVAVKGPDAEIITRNHMNFTPLGKGSPFYRMLDRQATILMLGTAQDTNSSLHLCEVLAELPYIHIPFSDNVDFEMAWYHNTRNEIEFVPVKEVPGCSRGFRAIEPELIKRGVLQEKKIGRAHSQVLVMQDLVMACAEILEKNPTLLLCHYDHCAICPKRRAAMSAGKN